MGFRRFYLIRQVDVSGISGTGLICEGVVFSTGKVALTWVGTFKSIGIYESVSNVLDIHGHGGATVLEWLD